jgi:TolB-like protein/class 3 adenylate cyclase/regulator of sirC expression with transglutaminase-like and TPR domain
LSDTGDRRRLEAILAADAVGYSRLMAADEDATVAALDAARAIFKARIEGNQGRIIDMAGDSVLAVFETATGAVTAALEIQKELNFLADTVAEDRRMRFRLGVHLGDVIEKADGTIYGDGVNIAARLQALAEPGGVTVSGMVQEAVRDRIAASFEDQGEHMVKNIARPVHVYRVDSSAHGVTTGTAKKFVQSARRLRWRVLAPAALLLAVAIGAWIATADSAKDHRVSLATFFGKKPSQASSARASIAVMPFANQSGDPKRDYFSDGITEDIINALGRFSGVMVISRNAVQAYKGRPMTSAEFSRELGVRYIAQGSVRHADGKLRVVVELSDAEQGAQLWSERYEGAGAEVFEVQDRIVKDIVGALAVKLTRIEQQRVFSKPTDSLEAYDLVLHARSLLDRTERSANREARALLARAQKLSPEYAELLIALADAEMQRALYGWIEDVAEAMRRGEELCKRVLASPDQRAHTRAHAVIAGIYSNQDRFEEALTHTERAIELNASDSAALYKRGMALLYVGRIDESIAAYELAKRFDPHPSVGDAFSVPIAYYVAGRYREALVYADALLARNPHHTSLHAIRAAALAQLGNADEARRAADQVRRFSPLFQVENWGRRFTNPEYTAKIHDGLRKAGL